MRKHILNYSYPQLVQYFEDRGEKRFRADQVWQWIFHHGVLHFREMKNLPSVLQKKLKKEFAFSVPRCVHKEEAKDKTIKYLFEVADKEHIETVMIPTAERTTLCVSTQVGCKFGCRFCASGLGGWKRNLECAEILGQVLLVKKDNPKRTITHIVFMGIGEPLDNYEELMKAIRIINHKKGMGIAARRITVSTCGLLPQIQRMMKEGLQIELAISLHGFDGASRSKLMPIERKYPLKDLIRICREYVASTNRQITFEYICIPDITITSQAPVKLRTLLKGIIAKINLIPYNPVPEFPYRAPTNEEITGFAKALKSAGINATIRRARGRDIQAACGQLRHLANALDNSDGMAQ